MKTFNEEIKLTAMGFGYSVKVERHGRRSTLVCTNRFCTLTISGNQNDGWQIVADTNINFLRTMKDLELYEYQDHTHTEYRVARFGDWAILEYHEVLEILVANS